MRPEDGTRPNAKPEEIEILKPQPSAPPIQPPGRVEATLVDDQIVFRPHADQSVEKASDSVLPTGHAGPATDNVKKFLGFRILESLLDPRTLQILMGIGSGVLVLGLVIWLWSVGLFDNPVTGAIVLGGLNFAVLVSGILTAKKKPHIVAGKGLTLLACLVLPLNLWFYDAQGLITIAEGGHLWIPALICTMIYTGVARVLKDKTFVYTVVGGVVLTGMLFLADNMIGRVGETIAPAVLLTVIGTICIQAKRLFPKNAGPFNQSTFGKAFYDSGHICLAAALATLGAGRLYHRLGYEFFGALDLVGISFYWEVMPLVILGTAILNYGYSWMVTGNKQFLGAIGLLAIWAELVTIDVLSIELTSATAGLVAAANALVAYGLCWGFRQPNQGTDQREDVARQGRLQICHSLGNWGWLVAALFTGISILSSEGLLVGSFEVTQLASMFVVALVAAAGLTTNPLEDNSVFSLLQLHIGSAFLLAAIVASSCTLDLPLELVVLTMAVSPWLLRAVGFQFMDERLREQMTVSANLHGVLAWMVGFAAWFFLTPEFASPWISHSVLSASAIALGLFFLQEDNKLENGIIASLSFNLAVWQLLSSFALQPIHYVSISAAIGFAGLLASRSSDAKKKLSRLNEISYLAVVFSAIATLMIGISAMIASNVTPAMMATTLGLSVAFVISSLLAGKDRRSGYALLAGAEAVLTVSLFVFVSSFSAIQIFEILLVSVGIACLGYGHTLWTRENENGEEETTALLLIGCLLVCLPLAAGLLGIRFGISEPTIAWRLIHEIGTLVAGLLLLGSGIFLRLKSTTLSGAGTLGMYLLSLIALIHLPDQLQSTSFYMMVGGGLFFGIAILLSVFRERLLAIPKRIENKEGVFQVLKWR